MGVGFVKKNAIDSFKATYTLSTLNLTVQKAHCSLCYANAS